MKETMQDHITYNIHKDNILSLQCKGRDNPVLSFALSADDNTFAV